MNYIESDCTIKHNGKEFTSGGAFVNEKYITAYLGENGLLTDWHGKSIGRYWITSTWKTPRSSFSGTMSQVYANVDGIEYTGRSAGIGMVFNGKVKK